MKNTKSIPVYLLLIVLCSIFIVSCSEDSPVTPPDGPYQFDSARYDWSFQSFSTEFLTFEAIDTTNIFLLGIRALVKYDGFNFNYNYYDDNSFYPLTMGSYDKNNIYIGGDDNSVSSENGKPRMKKWNGSTFDEIPIKDSANRHYQISAIQAKGENEIWMGSTRGDLIQYNNGSFEFLRIDTTFIFTFFGTDEMGNFYSVAQKTVFDSLTSNYLNIYKKVNNAWDWTLVFSEKYTGYDINEIQPSRINSEISGFKKNNIMKFTGNTFREIFNIKPFIAYQINQFSDSTFNSFMLPGGNDNSGLKLFNWNGSKWSLEISFGKMNIFGDVFHKISNVNGKYYFIYSDYVFGITYFGKGKIKTVTN